MKLLWLIPALACYALSGAGFILDRSGVRARFTASATILLAAGAALQTIDLVHRALLTGTMPVTDFDQSLAFLAWITAIAGLALIMRFRMPVVGAFIAPIVFVALGVAMAATQRHRLTVPEALRSAWLPIHVTLAFLGYAMFVLAASVSVVYLIYEHRLKAKKTIRAADNLAPSLEKLDRINYHLLGWGFLMLSLAIVSGAIWADTTWGHFWSWEPQEFWSLVIWLLYAALLESRITVGWRGRRAAALTIVVFTVLVGSFLGVSLINPGKHGGSFG